MAETFGLVDAAPREVGDEMALKPGTVSSIRYYVGELVADTRNKTLQVAREWNEELGESDLNSLSDDFMALLLQTLKTEEGIG